MPPNDKAKKVKRKAIPIDAVLYDGSNFPEVEKVAGKVVLVRIIPTVPEGQSGPNIKVTKEDGRLLTLQPGQWLVIGDFEEPVLILTNDNYVARFEDV